MTNKATFVLGMGAQKAGTTWLYSYMASLDSFAMGFRKEYHVLDAQHVPSMQGRHKSNLNRGIKALSNNFGPSETRKALHQALLTVSPDDYFDYFHGLLARSGRSFTSDMTPSHSALPKSALRHVQREFDRRGITVKPLFLMRDPVERAWSALRMRRRDRSLRLRDLSAMGVDNPYELSDDELLRLLPDTPSYRVRANYPKIIERIESVFAPQDTVFGFYEELFTDTTIRRIAEEIGFDYGPPDFGRVSNASPKTTQLEPQTIHDLTLRMRPVYKYCAHRWGPEHIAEIWPNARRIWRDIAPTSLPMPSWAQHVAPPRRPKTKITRIVLHIGTHKTGTSAIQAATHLNRNALLEAGFLYPQVDHMDRHALLAVPYMKQIPREFQGRFGDDKATADALTEQYWADVAQTIASHDTVSTLVLSTEYFSIAQDIEGLLNKVQSLAPEAEIETLVYLRRPDDRYLSGQQQIIKASHTLHWPHQRTLLPDLSPWATRSKLVLREYNRDTLIGGDVVSDFLTTIGYPHDLGMLRSLPDANVSMSAEGMAVMLAFRRVVYGTHNNVFNRASNRLLKTLHEAADTLPEDLRPLRPRLRPALRAAAIKNNQTQLHHLRDTLGFCFSDPSLYDPLPQDLPELDTSQPPRLDQIIDVDETRLTALYAATLAKLL